MVKVLFLKYKYRVQMQLKQFNICVLIYITLTNLTSQSKTISAGTVL